MAGAEAKSTSSFQDDLKCGLCSNTFVDATVLPNCGHTFCRECLKNCPQSFRKLDHTVCPDSDCKKINKYSPAKGVDDFPSNLTVNKMVDKYRREDGCTTEPPKQMPKPGTPLPESTSRSDFKWKVTYTLKLRGQMRTMANYQSPKSVVIGYGDTPKGVDVYDAKGAGNTKHKVPSEMQCNGIMFQKNKSFFILNAEGVHLYSKTGDKQRKIPLSKFPRNIETLSRGLSDKSDEILITASEKRVYNYNFPSTTPERTIQTKHITHQASATSSGLIIASSCWDDPSVVTVYDRDGNAGESVQAPEGVSLYAAVDIVDKKNTVYIASVKKNNMVIRLYDIDGLNLKERLRFEEVPLEEACSDKCSLVSLSEADMLAFASGPILYLLKYPDLSDQVNNMSIK